MTDPATEQMPVHRVWITTPRGVARMARGYCQCGTAAIGPLKRIERWAAKHEGRRA